jgi:hypothetical protein
MKTVNAAKTAIPRVAEAESFVLIAAQSIYHPAICLAGQRV